MKYYLIHSHDQHWDDAEIIEFDELEKLNDYVIKEKPHWHIVIKGNVLFGHDAISKL